jgi:rare lipoprotein A (peptidoglycan hydrolase)
MLPHPHFTRSLAATLAVGVALTLVVRPVTATPGREFGLASYYGEEFDSLRTASGEPFDPDAMTAAHRTLPFGTRVRVTNLANGRSTVVRINDRGPFVKGRVLDLSYGAARALRLVGPGVGPVVLEALHRGPGRRPLHGLWRRRSYASLGPFAARIDQTRVARSGA